MKQKLSHRFRHVFLKTEMEHRLNISPVQEFYKIIFNDCRCNLFEYPKDIRILA